MPEPTATGLPAQPPPDPGPAFEQLRQMTQKELTLEQAVNEGVPMSRGVRAILNLTTGQIDYEIARAQDRPKNWREKVEGSREFMAALREFFVKAHQGPDTTEMTEEQRQMLALRRGSLDEFMVNREFIDYRLLKSEEIAKMKAAVTEHGAAAKGPAIPNPVWARGYGEGPVPDDKFETMLQTVHPDHIADASTGGSINLSPEQRERLHSAWQQHWSREDPEGIYQNLDHSQRMEMLKDNPFLDSGWNRPTMPRNWRGRDGNLYEE